MGRGAATLVRYLSSDTHRMRMLRHLDDHDPDVGTPIAQALGHLSFSQLSDQALRRSLGSERTARESAKLYALGMTGSPGLSAIARSGEAPDWQRAGARWWIAGGPAIRT